MKRALPHLLFALTLAGCASGPEPAPAPAEPPAEARPDAASFSSPESALNYYLMIAELAADDGEYQDALDAYLVAMDLTDDAGVAERTANLALHTGRIADAWDAARRWRELEPDADGPIEVEAIAALRRGDIAAARVRVDRLLERWGARDHDVYRTLARLFYDEADPAAVVELFRGIAEDTRASAAWQVTGLLALRAQDLDTARHAAERARTLEPASSRAAVIEARVLVASGETEKGLALMRATVAENPDDPTLRFTLAGLYLNARQFDDALNELEQVVAEVPSYMDARWTLGLLLLQREEPDAAEPHLRALLADPTRRPNVPYYLGGVYEVKGDHATALEWFDQVASGEHVIDARIKGAQMAFLLGDIEGGRTRLANARGEFPEQGIRLFRAEAQLLEQNGDDDAALAVFAEAVRAMPGEASLLYSRALFHERSGRYEAAIADLRRVHEMRPDSAEAQNALGYLLADRGPPHALAEARELIASAIAQEPANPAIIDSMGWVLYRLGDLAAAREWLERAWTQQRDAEVGAHLGEVLWQLGERGAAREIWSAAAAIDGEHRVLVETLERFGVEP